MDLALNFSLGKAYKSKSQKIRIITESWTIENIYCPYCGKSIHKSENNRPVGDSFCNNDHEEFELKSMAKRITKKIMGGQYDKMIERITSDNNPNFFILSYLDGCVNNFYVIPKYLITPNIVKKRNPLAKTAQRAGWTGCNILADRIPEIGKVYYVKNGQIIKKQTVLEQFSKIAFIKQEKSEVKSWLLDVIKVIENINTDEFSLQDTYNFEDALAKLHPRNQNIRPKIRQQLQILRDKKLIKFLGNGRYKKISL